MRKIYLVGLVIILVLTACSSPSDYELRLVENDNKFTVSTADSTSDTIIYSYVIDNSETIELYLEDVVEEEENEFEVGEDHLHDSIVVEEDVIQADIDAMTSSNSDIGSTSSTEQADLVDEQELDETEQADLTDEQELDETDEVEEQEVDQTDEQELDETEQADLVDKQELDETEQADLVDKEELIFEQVQELVVEVQECTHTEQEHTFTQTLIDYVGRGNYDRWVANAVPTCENGLTIYDYMSYFNMTASFFANLTSNDIVYSNLNLY